MLLTNVASWYWDNKETELISYFDLNNNWTEQVTNTDCSSMLGSGQEVRWIKDPLDNTRYVCARSTSTAGSSGNTHGLYTVMFSDPRSYQSGSGDSSRFKYFIPAYTASHYDPNIYSELLGNTVEFMYLKTTVSDSTNRYILCGYDYAGSSTPGTVMGYDIVQNNSTVTIYCRNTNTTGQGSSYHLYYSMQANVWYRFKIHFISVTSSSYRIIVELFDSNDTLLATYNEQNRTVPCGQNSANTNDRTIRFFNSAWGWAKAWPNITGCLKEFKIYQTS